MKIERIRQSPSGPVTTCEIPETSTDIVNASAVPGQKVTDALNHLAASGARPEIALWVLDNDIYEWPILLGYTAAQIAESYSAPRRLLSTLWDTQRLALVMAWG